MKTRASVSAECHRLPSPHPITPMGLHGPAAWSTTLATVLRSKVPLTGDGFRIAPPAEDPFWQTAQKELETGLGPKADAFWAAVSAALASRLGEEGRW